MAQQDDFGPKISAGPVVRPYALTGGRTQPAGEQIDLVAQVTLVRSASADQFLHGPEHLKLLALCRSPTSVAELAAELDLPLGVVRIFLSDLRRQGLIMIHPPTSVGFADVRILKEVADALRRL